MGYVFHFIVTVNHVDTCIDQIQVSTQLHIAGVEHIGEQRKIVFVTVAGYIIILIGLCAQVRERGEKIDVVSLNAIFYLFLQ